MQRQGNDRVGPMSYDMQVKSQMDMISNVFYQFLTSLGQKNQDHRMLELANQVKDLLQTGSYDDLMGPKVPMLKSNILNLLKIIDVSEQEKMQLVRMGLGDVFSQQIRTVGQVKEALNLKLEQEDPLKASTIYFQFLVFKTGNTASMDTLPKRVFF